ncbi:hypothetical protein [Marinomonas flavescens]|uniref:hypothetical protein n=1 Tax=Marinomonas flavescens TaxID=2529379 RepID=UPI0010557BCE|nr:hypothetical protein [Marinomonas flavescens]
MMIVDLVDEVDFKEKLIALGAPISQQQSLDEVRDATLAWLKDYPEQISFVQQLCQEMEHNEVTVLPEVKALLQRFASFTGAA